MSRLATPTSTGTSYGSSPNCSRSCGNGPAAMGALPTRNAGMLSMNHWFRWSFPTTRMTSGRASSSASRIWPKARSASGAPGNFSACWKRRIRMGLCWTPISWTSCAIPPELGHDPVALALGGQQPAEDHAREVRGGDRHVLALDLAGERVAGALRQLGIDVAQAGPLVVQQLHRAVDHVAQQQTASRARREDDDGAAGCVAWRGHGVDAGDQRTAAVPGGQPVLDGIEHRLNAIVVQEVLAVARVAAVAGVAEDGYAFLRSPADVVEVQVGEQHVRHVFGLD